MRPFKLQWCFAVSTLCLFAAATQLVHAQAAPTSQPAAAAAESKPFKPEELEQLTAPIALYPDSLVAQIFMASTYPLEVVQADRWRSENKDVKGDALAAELNKQSWDPSVKSLVDFPQVLEMMSKQLDWTTKLGDAFIADQAAVMAAVQRLRAKAQAQGNLKDSAEQKIVVEQAPPQTVVVQGAPPPPPQIIKIESTSPTVVYVPTYSPTVVYGAWPYPAYPPPPPYYPPPPGSRLLAFGAGVAVGAAWGHAWGDCNWGGGDVDIDVNRNATLNRSIDRQSYQSNIQSRSANAQGAGKNTFAHDPSHRKGVSYRDQASAAKVGQPANAGAAGRENYRGRSDAGVQGSARSGASASQQPGARGNSGNRGASATPMSANQGAGGSRGASPSPSRSSAGGGGAFAGANQSGAAARADSSRGQASRSSASPSRSGGSSGGGGGSRSGGGSRGGGAGGRR